jgi:hypothetical protein
MPVFGSISFNDMTSLANSKFARLCEVGIRSLSTHVQMRMEYRDSYERGVGAEPYFWISY